MLRTTEPIRRFTSLTLCSILTWCCATIVSAAVHGSSTTTDAIATAEIESLVRQLGSDHYIRREQARTRLAEYGSRAFDALHAVISDSDTEIRMQAESLLRGIHVELVRPGDSDEVRRELSRFENASAASKLDVLDRLAALANDEGRDALCRIVRFNTSEFISKKAALAFFASERPVSPARVKQLKQFIDRELQASKRTAAGWLKVYAEYLKQPEASIQKWNDVLLAEEATYREQESSTQRILIRDLLHWHAFVTTQLGRSDESLAAIQRIIPQFVKQPVDVVNHLDWLTDHKAWVTIDELAAEHHDAIESNALMQYQVARSFDKRGNTDKAKELADAAFEMSTEPAIRVIIGDELLKRMEFDWFERELRAAITDSEDASESLFAQYKLIEKYFDWEEYAESLELLEEVIGRAEKDKEFAELLRDLIDQFKSMRDIAKARLLKGNAEKSEERRALLESALRLHDENIDILIELYRLPDNSESYQAELKLQIERRVNEYQKQIDAQSNIYRQRGFGSSRKDLASHYNEYAWLVGNTFGDFEKALEYSKRSLDLRPNSPDYLDTLRPLLLRQERLRSRSDAPAAGVQSEAVSGPSLSAIDVVRTRLCRASWEPIGH